MLANRWRNGTRQFSLVSSRVAQSRVDKIEIGDNPITGTVTVANWMFRSTMDGKVQRSIHPVVWVSSIPIRRGQRTRPPALPGNPFQALTASEFTLQDQQLRHEPTAGTWMDVSVNGFAATPVCLSKAKGRVVDADVGFTFAYDTGLLPNHLFRFKEEKGSRTMIKRGL